MKRAAFAALFVLGAGSLLFDLTLRARLPSDADWAEAAAALRARHAGLVQLWPPWTEEARRFVDAPISIEEDLAHADYVGAGTVWLLSSPRAPFAREDEAVRALAGRGATPVGEPLRFGALRLREWDLHAAPVASELTNAREEHEVDYVPRRCVPLHPGTRLQARGAGAVLHVRAGIIGERAFDAGRPAVTVEAFADGRPSGTLEVPGTAADGEGWRRLDANLDGDRERAFLFAVASPDPSRPLCLQAWTTR